MACNVLEAFTERGFVEKYVNFIQGSIVSHQKKFPGHFVLGLSGGDGRTQRERIGEVFKTLAESDAIDWGRVAIFLLEERFGVPECDTNAHLVRSALLGTLGRRSIDFSEEQLLLPNVKLDSEQRCATDYQTRLLTFFTAHGVEGPHLVALELGADMSISGVFPDWYKEDSGNWADAISKSCKVLCTTRGAHGIVQRHVCVNLGLIRRARQIVVNTNEISDEAWRSVREDAGADAETPTWHRVQSVGAETRRRSTGGSVPPSKAAASHSPKPMPSTPDPYRLPRFLSPPGSPRRHFAPPPSPLSYVMKYKHITVVQLKVDEENHYSFVIIGALGDLARKKTFPALFQLHLSGHMPASARIIGCDDPQFHSDVRSTEDMWEKRLLPYLEKETGWRQSDLIYFYSRIDFMPVCISETGSFGPLHAHIQALAKGRKQDNRICYLALPSKVFLPAIQRLREECWPTTGFGRVIVEKPFGRNRDEACELSRKIARHLEEPQIYRIDHYLAKTLVLNILTLRFANREFGTLFHTYHVANVRITFQEDFGVEGRAGYFNDYGIIRDIMQNHLMQVLTLIAMEAPASLEAEDVRDEKVKVLKQIRPIRSEDCVIGQYEGYQDDPQIQAINKERGYPSRCPTFAVVVLYLDNDRWSGVPFIMKAGKGLKTTQTTVRVQFKKAPSHSLFGEQPQNEMVIRIQPNEAIYYKMLAKMPGISQKAKDVRRTKLDLDLNKGGGGRSPEAYEKLIYDVLQGQSHNFVRRDELEQAWRIFDPLLHELEGEEPWTPLRYPLSSGGPRAADDLIRSMGFQKYTPTGVAVSGFSDDEVA